MGLYTGVPVPPPRERPFFLRTPVLVLGGLAVAIVFGLMAYWFATAMLRGRSESNAAVQQFHREFNSGDYETIAKEADEAFSETTRHDALLSVLQRVHGTLGDETNAILTGISVNASNGASYLNATYQTAFAAGSGVETFEWKKDDGVWRLYAYRVNSPAFDQK